MNHPNDRADYLLQRLRAGTASQEELNELLQLLDSDEVSEKLGEIWEGIPGHARIFDEEHSEQMLTGILNTDEPAFLPPPLKKKKWLVPVLSALVIILACSTWFFYPGRKATKTPAPQPVTTDSSIVPRNK